MAKHSPKVSSKVAFKEMQTAFISAVAGSSVLLQVLFLANLSYLYATQFNSSDCVHDLKILYVDHDGGVVDQSVTEAYQGLKGNDFPTLYTEPAVNTPHQNQKM